MKKRRFLKINTSRELGYQLGLPEAFLIRIMKSIQAHYKTFPDRDKKGKERIFYSADLDLKKIHKKINKLLNIIDFPFNIQGGLVGCSIATNASIHSGKKFVANYDIKNFFPSVNYKTVYKSFRAQKCSPDVSRILTRYTSADGSLPQGFATSPKVSGIVLLGVNKRLSALFQRFGLIHSFWIDDLTISGNYPIKKFQKILYKIFKQAGFSLP